MSILGSHLHDLLSLSNSEIATYGNTESGSFVRFYDGNTYTTGYLTGKSNATFFINNADNIDNAFVGIGTYESKANLHVQNTILTSNIGTYNEWNELYFNCQNIGGISNINITGDLYANGIIIERTRWTLTDYLDPSKGIYYSSNIGIGSTIPTEKLDVIGNIRTDSQLISTVGNSVSPLYVNSTYRVNNLNVQYLNNNNSDYYRNATNINSGTLSVVYGGTGSNLLSANKVLIGNGTKGIISPVDLHWDTTNMRLGMGSTTPETRLDVNGSIKTTNQLISTINTGTSPLSVISTTQVNNLNVQYLSSNTADFYRNVNNVNAGILAVARGGTATGILNPNKIMIGNGTNGVLTPDNLHWNDSLKRLGIGTTNPQTTGIHICDGSSGINVNLPTLFVENNSSSSTLHVFRTSTSGGQNSFNITNTGFVGIGITNPTKKFCILDDLADNSFPTTVLNPSLPNNRVLCQFFGKSETIYNCGFLSFNNFTTSSATNTVSIGVFGQNAITQAPLHITGNQTDGNVGIGLTNPASKLSISNNISVGSSYDTIAAPRNGLIVEGNIGIGVTNPVSRLEITGNAVSLSSAGEPTYKGTIRIFENMSSTLSANGGIEFKVANNYGHRICSADFGGATTPLVFQTRSNNASWTNSLTISNFGNIGIGTTVPQSKGLHICDGTSGINLAAAQIPTLYIENSGNSASSFVFKTSTSGGQNSFNVTNAGCVGVGVTNPTAKLDINGTVNITDNLTFTFPGGTSKYINFVESGQVDRFGILTEFAGTSDQNRLSITSSGASAVPQLTDAKITLLQGGKVGIGVTNPSKKLSIVDDLADTNVPLIVLNTILPTTSKSTLIFLGKSETENNCAFISFNNFTNSTTANTVSFGIYGQNALTAEAPLHITGGKTTTTGYVGIGTTNPLHRLAVHSPSAATTGVISVANSTRSHFLALYSGDTTNDQDQAIIYTSSRNLRFGTWTAMTYATGWQENMRLTSAGSLLVRDNITAYSTTITSDIKFKENVKDISNGISVINKLRPVSYNWKNNIQSFEKRGTYDIGFIAQEVEKVVPHIVKEYENLDDKEIYKTVNYERIIPYLTKAMQEMHEIIEKQNSYIKSLESDINDIKARLSAANL